MRVSADEKTKGATMSDLQTLLERNRQFAAVHDGESLGIRPRLSTVVLTCLDARVDPAHFLGLELGDALVLRNAGGRVTADVERDLAIVWALVSQMAGGGPPPIELAIVHHTDCGMERFADPERRKLLSRGSGVDEGERKALAISDHETSLVNDIERLRRSKLVPGALVVSGHLYDVKTGTMRQVVGPTTVRTEEVR